MTDLHSANELARRAANARACQATAMNATSSRSHSVFMLYISGAHAPSSTRLQGCLCLVDLAGRYGDRVGGACRGVMHAYLHNRQPAVGLVEQPWLLPSSDHPHSGCFGDTPVSLPVSG